jgi:hypothetical protein
VDSSSEEAADEARSIMGPGPTRQICTLVVA